MSAVADRLEIIELIGRYSFGADGDVPENYAAVFAPDGEFVGRTGQPDEVHVRGRDALTRFARGAVARREASSVQNRHHQSTTIFLELTGDRARTRTYLMTTSTGDDGVPRLGLTSVYDDDVERIDGSWRLVQRRTMPDVKGVLADRQRDAGRSTRQERG